MKPVNLLRHVALAALMVLAVTSVASASDLKPARPRHVPQVLRTWSYLGPAGGLVGARITLTDGKGKVVARGTTQSTGTFTFDLRGMGKLAMPLTVTTSGGTVRGQHFTGHLRARSFGMNLHTPIVQVSPISTAASHMASKQGDYLRATEKVRTALGFKKGSIPDALRIKNGDVGFVPLVVAASRHGGFDEFAADLAVLAKAGKKVGSLRPAWAKRHKPAKGGAKTRQYAPASGVTTNTTSTGSYDSPMCNATLPSNSNSESTISDVVTIGSSVLLKAAGVPSAANSTVTGMILGPMGLAQPTTPDAAALNAVVNDLNCISAQLNYLITAVNALQLETLLESVSTCQNEITTDYYNYQYILQNEDIFQQAASDTTLADYASGDGSEWGTHTSSCQNEFNNMLFGTLTPASTAGWPLMVNNTLGSVQWYTQAQVQELQQFLSYWGMLTYQELILQSEYNNYNGSMTAMQSASGVQYTMTEPRQVVLNSNGDAQCLATASSTAPTYCVYASNIAHAFPPNLYSDEVALTSSGTAVEAIPGGVLTTSAVQFPGTAGAAGDVVFPGLDADYGFTNGKASSMNPAWFWNYYLNFTPWKNYKTNKLRVYGFGNTPTCVTNNVGSCPISGVKSESWYWDAVGLPNSLTNNGANLNPQGLGTAQQTYENPQVAARNPVSWADVSTALTTNGPGGTTPAQQFYDNVNQTGGWSGAGIDPGEVLYMTNDSSSYITAQASGDSQYVTSVYLTWNGAFGSMKTGYTDTWASDLPTTPVFAFLVGRSWWPATSGVSGSGSAGAGKYTPPSPANWAVAD